MQEITCFLGRWTNYILSIFKTFEFFFRFFPILSLIFNFFPKQFFFGKIYYNILPWLEMHWCWSPSNAFCKYVTTWCGQSPFSDNCDGLQQNPFEPQESHFPPWSSQSVKQSPAPDTVQVSIIYWMWFRTLMGSIWTIEYGISKIPAIFFNYQKNYVVQKLCCIRKDIYFIYVV